MFFCKNKIIIIFVSTHPAFLIMFALSVAVAMLYFFLFKKTSRYRSRTRGELSVHIPHRHPDYALTEKSGDKQWLLKPDDDDDADDDSDTDMEEWKPINNVDSNNAAANARDVTDLTPV